MRGGKREGAGRPKAPESVVIRVRVAPEVAEAIHARGGAIWLKRVIREAICSSKTIAEIAPSKSTETQAE
jgi:hypothetical protein